MYKYFIIILLSTFTSIFSVSGKGYYTKNGVPRFWTWLDYRPAVNYDSIFSLYSTHGVHGVNMNVHGDLEAFQTIIPVAKKYHIDLYAWFWGLNQIPLAAKHPEWLDYNAKGESLANVKAYVDHYKFINPAIPEFREELKKQIETLCNIKGLKGISLDFTRYVDAILPVGIQPKYNIVQDKVYPQWDYGYHPVAIEKFKKLYGYDPRMSADPAQDSVWFQFRLNQVTECVLPLVKIIHHHKKLISASPFPTPSLARYLVRQDWTKWNLDFYLPMIYYGFYKQNYEWLGTATKECVNGIEKKSKIFSAIFVNDVKKDGVSVKQLIKIAMDNGSEGVAFFGRPDLLFLESIRDYDK